MREKRARSSEKPLSDTLVDGLAKLEPDGRIRLRRRVDWKLMSFLPPLPPAHWELLAHVFGLDGNRPMTLREIAEHCGRCVEAIRSRL